MKLKYILPFFALLAGPCWAQMGGGIYNGGAGGGGGAVSVTASTPDIVINPSPGTGTFTVGATSPLNAQGTAATYTILASDMGKTVTHNKSTAVAVTLPVAGTAGFEAGNEFCDVNIGAGTVTITPVTSTINGNPTQVLTTGQGGCFTSDGTNYVAFLGVASGGSIGTPNTLAGYNGAGVFSGVAIGAGLSLSGGTLSANGNGGTLNYSDNGITATAGTYYAPIGGGGLPSTTEANVAVGSPSTLAVTNLQVALSAAPGAGQTLAVTLRDGGADKAVTCTISNAATSCSDLTHTFNVVQGDLIDWKIVTTGTYVGTPTITIVSNSGAPGTTAGGAANAIQPASSYTSDTAGNIFPYVYTGGGGNASASEAGWGVVASLGSDVALQMRFQMPSALPSGTFKLVSYCLANASSGTAKYTISDGNVASGSSPSAVALTGETQTSITWSAVDNYVVTKTVLSSTPLVDNVSVVAVTFNSTGWTLAQIMSCRWVEIWE